MCWAFGQRLGVGIEDSAEVVLLGYRRNIERADAIIASSSLDTPPAWWPEGLFGSWRLHSVREIVLHGIPRPPFTLISLTRRAS